MAVLPVASITPFRAREAVGMFDWVKDYSGQARVPVFTCPDVFVAMCDGDTLCALFLSQVYFEQQQLSNGQEWVIASVKYWSARLGLSAYQIRTFAQKLSVFGLRTEKRGVHPSITWHFRIEEGDLRESVKGFYEKSLTMKNLTVSNDENLDDQPSKITSLTSENFTINDEKFNGSISKENKETKRETKTLPNANAFVGVAAAPGVSSQEKIKPLSEDDAEYKLAYYLYDAIQRIDPDRVMTTSRTLKGISSWIDPPRGKGLRQLLIERGEGDERKDIRKVIDWLALPTTTSYWQSRFLNRKNNPGKILYDCFSEMRNASIPRMQTKGAPQNARQNREPAAVQHESTKPDIFGDDWQE